MNRKVLGPVIAAGALLGGCGNNGPSQEVLDTHAEVLGYYNCDVEPAEIKISNLSERSAQTFGDESVGLALTDREGIVLGSNNSNDKLVQLIIHETVHWCTDQENSHNYQANPVEIPGIGLLTGSEGFAPFLDYSQARLDTFVEEGVTDWLSQAFDGYELHHEYKEMALLTEKIANYRGFTRQQVAALHNEDDLLGLIGLMKDKSTAEINGSDINDIFYLYLNTGETQTIPSDEELKSILELENL